MNQPNSKELERSILGSMISFEESLATGISELSADDFYTAENAEIFKALIEAFRSPEKGLDIVRYADDLDRAVSERKSGKGWGFVLSEIADCAGGKKISHLCEKLRDYTSRREGIKTAAKIQAACIDLSADFVPVLESSFSAITMRKNRANESGYEHVSETSAEILDELLAPPQERKQVFIKSPWEKLNSGIIGFFPGELTVVAARPSMGKTAFGLCIALHTARLGKRVAICSMEMNKRQLANRFYSMMTGISPVRIKSKNLSTGEIGKISEAHEQLKNMPLLVDDSRRMSPLKIRSKLMQAECDMLIVDYLDKFSGERGETQYEKLSRCVVELEDLAIELNIPVVCLQQVSRFVEKTNPQKKNSKIPPPPRMSDLLGSGVIENTAYVIMAIHRDEYYSPGTRPGEADVFMLKNRDGQRMTHTVLGFDGPSTTFKNELPEQEFDQTHWSD